MAVVGAFGLRFFLFIILCVFQFESASAYTESRCTALLHGFGLRGGELPADPQKDFDPHGDPVMALRYLYSHAKSGDHFDFTIEEPSSLSRLNETMRSYAEEVRAEFRLPEEDEDFAKTADLFFPNLTFEEGKPLIESFIDDFKAEERLSEIILETPFGQMADESANWEISIRLDPVKLSELDGEVKLEHTGIKYRAVLKKR